MQQEKRRRVFRAGLSVKDGEPINLYGAIKSLALRIDASIKTGPVAVPKADEGCKMRYPSPSA